MAMDKAEADYEQASTDTNTAQTLTTAVVNATLAPYTNYTSYTSTYDSTDALIGSFLTKAYFGFMCNENRLAIFKELLSWNVSKIKAEVDENMQFFDHTI